MEIFFASLVVCIMLVSIVMQLANARKIRQIDSRFEPLYKKNEIIVNELFRDIEGMENGLVLLSEKIEALPNMIQDDTHRFLKSLKEDLSAHIDRNAEIARAATPTYRANNWDSMKEAFKGPTRIEVNERT